MNLKFTGILLVILIAAGSYFAYTKYGAPRNTSTAEAGSYAYSCANGSEFSIEPSTDVSSLMLTPGAGASFQATTLSKVESNAGQRFEGEGIVFVGAGEEVQLTVMGGETLICNPVPSADMAPWNWGDAGEGSGVKQDASLIVTESIRGKWQSVDDPKFVREFKEGDVVIDWYENKKVSNGMYVAFTKINAPEVPFPLEESAVYLQLTVTGSQADTLNFKLVKLTPDELELIYLERGGTLRFKAIE